VRIRVHFSLESLPPRLQGTEEEPGLFEYFVLLEIAASASLRPLTRRGSMHEGTESAPEQSHAAETNSETNTQAAQTNTQATAQPANIDRKRGFDLDYVLKLELPINPSQKIEQPTSSDQKEAAEPREAGNGNE
jgi:hypothetical protein